MIDLDAIDRRILAELQRRGRASNVELARRANLSASACLRRVRRLEDNGVIESYAAVLNPRAVDRAADVFVSITLHSQAEEALTAFEAAVADCPDVMACYLMSGDTDYLLRVSARDAADYERIHKTMLGRLPGVSRIRSDFAMRAVLKRTALPV